MSARFGARRDALTLRTRRSAEAIRGGGPHNCARLDDETVKCWGQNTSGQLGLGDTMGRGTALGQMGDMLPPVLLGVGRRVASIAAYKAGVCATFTSGQIKCWGLNGNGELGIGDVLVRGPQTTHMGDMLPVVDLGP